MVRADPDTAGPDTIAGRDPRRVVEGLLGTAATDGNRVEILRDGVAIFPAMLQAIRQARRTVDLLTFVYWQGDVAERFAEALVDRARAGVRCRVVLDALSAQHVTDDLIGWMTDEGVQVRWFRPLKEGEWPGHRTHRKVLICDEAVAFTGGVGIADEWDGSSDDGSGWRETQIRLTGPVVDGLRAAFVDDWLEVDTALFDANDRFPIQPEVGEVTALTVRGAAEHGYSDVALLRRILWGLAQERVRITTAYLSPDETVRSWIQAATDRGVRVEILVPGPRSDKEIARLAGEEVYDRLLEAGAELHEFTPTMLHAKVMTVDGTLAVVGSANLNSRSLRHDEEIDVVLFDEGITRRLDEHTDQDLARSEPVHHGRWKRDGTVRRLAQKAVGLTDRWI